MTLYVWLPLRYLWNAIMYGKITGCRHLFLTPSGFADWRCTTCGAET
jgi:LSD1 subclass zinc finger protein